MVGIVVGVIGGNQRARLPELRFRLLHVLVIDVDQLFQPVQLRDRQKSPTTCP